MLKQNDIDSIFEKWIRILRLKNQWDITFELIEHDDFKKTGDLKIDCTDKKAIVFLNAKNPKKENMEEVICHELLHLKLYPLDQLTEGMILSLYEQGSKESNYLYHQFFTTLEITVEEMTKCFLEAFGNDKQLSYGRCKELKSYNELFDDLKNL